MASAPRLTAWDSRCWGFVLTHTIRRKRFQNFRLVAWLAFLW